MQNRRTDNKHDRPCRGKKDGMNSAFGSGHFFKKQFGQNFLSDDALLADIVADADLSPDDAVLEIGPGAGALTRHLAKAAKKVVAYEIDTDLKRLLSQNLADCPNTEVVFKDFMRATDEEITEKLGNDYAVVANLPYYITAPVITLFIEKVQRGARIKSLTLTLQKEVADRLVAKEGTADYGAITVALASVAESTLTRTVDRSLFYPVPNVDSAVVTIRFKGNRLNVTDYSSFREITRCAFAQRRKTLSNNVMSYFKTDRTTAETWLSENGIDGSVRGETLSPQQFATLANNLYKLKRN